MSIDNIRHSMNGTLVRTIRRSISIKSFTPLALISFHHFKSWNEWMMKWINIWRSAPLPLCLSCAHRQPGQGPRRRIKEDSQSPNFTFRLSQNRRRWWDRGSSHSQLWIILSCLKWEHPSRVLPFWHHIDVHQYSRHDMQRRCLLVRSDS